jgi:hypothetical protein
MLHGLLPWDILEEITSQSLSLVTVSEVTVIAVLHSRVALVGREGAYRLGSPPSIHGVLACSSSTSRTRRTDIHGTFQHFFVRHKRCSLSSISFRLQFSSDRLPRQTFLSRMPQMHCSTTFQDRPATPCFSIHSPDEERSMRCRPQ